MSVFALFWFACRDPQPSLPPPPPSQVTTPQATPPGPIFDGEVPRNLIMLSIDTLRRDALGRYDPRERNLSPFLDEIAASGVVFEDVIACSNWTVTSTGCVLSGAGNIDRAEARGGVPILTSNNQVLTSYPEGTPMLPSFLRPHGYSSLLLSTNGFFGENHGSAQGYDRFIYSPGSATELWEEAVVALDEQPLTEPFFLHLHFFEPHKPYLPPKDYSDERIADLPPSDYDLSSYLVQAYASTIVSDLPADEQAILKDHFRAFYEAEVRWLDDQLRAIWAELDARDLLENSLVVIWTDHGEALWEHTYDGHGHLLFPNENAMALYLWAKNLRPGVVTAPLEAADIAPTLLSLWQLPIPPEMTGTPYRLDAPPPASRVRTAFSDAFFGPVNAAHQDHFSLQFAWGLPQPLMLVDLANDPDGIVNLYDPSAPHPMAFALWPTIEAEVQAVLPFMAVDPRAPTPNWPEVLMNR